MERCSAQAKHVYHEDGSQKQAMQGFGYSMLHVSCSMAANTVGQPKGTPLISIERNHEVNVRSKYAHKAARAGNDEGSIMLGLRRACSRPEITDSKAGRDL